MGFSYLKTRDMGLRILVFGMWILSGVCLGQIEANTKDGKKVILDDDGTWKYFVDNKNTSVTTYECSELVSNEVDKMTGKSTRSMKEGLVISEDGTNGFGILAYEVDGTIGLSIIANGAGSCIDDMAKMNVLFRDGTRLELRNNGKFNCEGKFTIYFGGGFGKKKELESFRTREVETLRVWTSKSYVERDFQVEDSKKLMVSLTCLNVK
jgi:VCBS repeat-containing protein